MMTLLVRNSRHPGSEGAVPTKGHSLFNLKLAEADGSVHESVHGDMFRPLPRERRGIPDGRRV